MRFWSDRWIHGASGGDPSSGFSTAERDRYLVSLTGYNQRALPFGASDFIAVQVDHDQFEIAGVFLARSGR